MNQTTNTQPPIPNPQLLTTYLLHLADTTHILAQRNSEWCGHGPILEQDIAITNISLDVLGQSRLFYQYAATLINQSTNQQTTIATEDSLAYLRNERDYSNLLLVELPKGDWAVTILRQYLFSQFQYLLFNQLQHNNDEQIAGIATKSIKETAYHVRWSKEWVIRLGDGTPESNSRMMSAIQELWPYTGEMFTPAQYETLAGINWQNLHQQWLENITATFNEATLTIPENVFMQTGGKTGVHTEHLGFILAEMQYLQRTHIGAEW